MTGPNEAAERIARSTIAEGWARLSIMALVPITLGLGGWIGVSLISQGARLAVLESQLSEHDRDIIANSTATASLLARVGQSDSAQARIEAEIAGMRQSLSRVEDMLSEILRSERRTEYNGPRP